MNLLAKSLRQLLVLAVALFFFSCEDDTSIIGYKNPNKKFNVRFVEIPLESSVMLLDPIRTSNYAFAGEINRFLVGQYTDPDFGNISAGFYSQYITISSIKLPADAVYDSVSLQLTFDFYVYGSASTATQTISVFELEQPLVWEEIKNYTAASEIALVPSPLGSKTFSVNPAKFEEYIEDEEDTTVSIKIPLPVTFGASIFNAALDYRDATTKEDSIFVNYEEFAKIFKGIAVKSDAGDKVIGFNPSASRISLHYHTPTKDSLALSLTLGGVAGFSQISADRSSTELAGLVPHQDALHGSPNRYIQSGTGIVTKVDLSNFYEFTDTIQSLLINSAELVISDVDGTLKPPGNLALRVIGEDNRFRLFSRNNSQDVIDLQSYAGYLKADFPSGTSQVIFNGDSSFYATNDQGTAGMLAYSTDKKSYRGFPTMFFQQLFSKDSRTKFDQFILYPLSPNAAKSVNHVVLPADKIKLRIHYTVPTKITP